MIEGRYITGKDGRTVYAVACLGGEMVAVGGILFDGERFTISRVAVRRRFRRQGYGDFIVRLLINRAMLAGAKEIYADVLVDDGKEAVNTDVDEKEAGASALQPVQALLQKIGFVPCGVFLEKNGRRWLPMCLEKVSLHKCCSHETNI